MIISFTGHRPDKLPGGYSGCYEAIRKPLIAALKDIELTCGKIEIAYSGMALGFDQIAAKVCLEQGIKVNAAIPCKNQDKKWIPQSKLEYKQLCDDIIKFDGNLIYVSKEEYTPWCMHKRDEFLVNKCDLLIACWNGNISGGTAHTIKYAQEVKKGIYNIWDMLDWSKL